MKSALSVGLNLAVGKFSIEILHRQRERKRAAFADLALHPNPAAVMLDDFFANLKKN